jgi:carbon monoxide dehydrogenase subunit G
MDMTGEERIAASREAVWAALNDVNVLKQCIPGCESLEKVSDTDMTARVKLQVGPVRAIFAGKVALSDLDPPNGYRISGEGQGGVAGYAKGGAVVRLLPDGAGTLLKYEAKADVGGKLAQLGGRLIDSTARKLAGEFFQKFGAVVGGAPVEAPGAAASAAPVKEGWFRRLWRRLFGGKAQTPA